MDVFFYLNCRCFIAYLFKQCWFNHISVVLSAAEAVRKSVEGHQSIIAENRGRRDNCEGGNIVPHTTVTNGQVCSRKWTQIHYLKVLLNFLMLLSGSMRFIVSHYMKCSYRTLNTNVLTRFSCIQSLSFMSSFTYLFYLHTSSLSTVILGKIKNKKVYFQRNLWNKIKYNKED